MPRIAFPTFVVEVPGGWRDLTALPDSDRPVPSLGREGGVGAMQFSVHRYRPLPHRAALADELLERIREFGRDLGMGEPSDVALEAEPVWLAAAALAREGFLRLWHVSDGHGLAFITYGCGPGEEDRGAGEVAECEFIVRRIKFREGRAGAGYGPSSASISRRAGPTRGPVADDRQLADLRPTRLTSRCSGPRTAAALSVLSSVCSAVRVR